jgi:hypothetical protein
MDTHPMVEFVTARLRERQAIVEDAHAPSDPERVIAQLEATRRIVANARSALDQGWQLGEEAREATAHLATRTLQHLAELDADHPDYDPAWQL